MITLETAENALKEVYLGVVSNTLNIGANPLLTKIKQSSSDVWGKENDFKEPLVEGSWKDIKNWFLAE